MDKSNLIKKNKYKISEPINAFSIKMCSILITRSAGEKIMKEFGFYNDFDENLMLNEQIEINGEGDYLVSNSPKLKASAGDKFLSKKHRGLGAG